MKKNGFTLIELLVVSTIILVVTAIGLVSYSNVSAGARDAQRKQDLEQVRTALLLFRTENGYYPLASLTQDARGFASVYPQTSRSPRALLTLLKNTFKTPVVFAALDSEFVQDDSGKGKEDSEISTPTPTPAPGGKETPVPTPIPSGDDLPAEAISYSAMAEGLIEQGYLQTDVIPLDPVNNATYYYGYTSDQREFELTATLEKDDSLITITSEQNTATDSDDL